MLFFLFPLICPLSAKAELDNKVPVISNQSTASLLQYPDTRTLAVSAFLDRFKCGSKIDDFNTATIFVTLADKYKIPYQYIPIFYLKESSCSKHMLFNNPFGKMKRGGESAGLVHYSSLNEAFEDEAEYLATPLYAGKTISQITHIYCPPREGEVYTYTSDFQKYYDQMTDWQTTYAKLSTGVISR